MTKPGLGFVNGVTDITGGRTSRLHIHTRKLSEREGSPYFVGLGSRESRVLLSETANHYSEGGTVGKRIYEVRTRTMIQDTRYKIQDNRTRNVFLCVRSRIFV